MSDEKIISFDEFRLKRKAKDSDESPIMKALKQDFRKQEDLIDWYLFHSFFNKYKLFLYSLFYTNHRRKKRHNPNSGYIMVFNKEQIDSIVKSTEEALKWLGRKYIIIDFKEKNLRKLGKMFPYDRCQSFGDLYNIMKRYLLRTDNVVVCKELSLSKIQQKKSGIARMLIKIIDDAHFDGISPLADVVFIDYASFLEKSWENIGSYLDILTTEYRA